MSYKGVKEVVKESVKDSVKEVVLNEVVELKMPKDDIYKRIKKLSSFKKIKRSYKLEQQKNQFLLDLNELFKHLNPEDHKYDVELLLELLNAVEQYFVYGTKEERDKSKQEVVEEVMLKFFNDDVNVLEKFIATIYRKVKKSNVWRRTYRRLYNFFF